MAALSLGKIAFSWKGVYAAGTTYNGQDVVSYNGTTFVCLVDGTVGQTPALLTTYWQQFAQGVSGIAASAGQLVYHNGTGLVALPVGTVGQTLTVSAAGLPQWGTPDVRSGSKVLRLPENNYRNQTTVYRRYGAIMTDGSVRMWGDNTSSLLGDGTTNSRSYPTRVGFGSDFPGASKLYLTSGVANYCIDTNNKLWSWGLNTNGQIGDNSITTRQVPYYASNDVLNSIYGKSISSMALASGIAGATAAMALATDGTVHMTGYGLSGQLGQGNLLSILKFTLVPGLTAYPIVKIAMGRESSTASYAINSNGQLYAWGYNTDGQLGNGLVAALNVATLITAGALNGKFVYDIVGGYQTAFAICRSTTATTTGTYASGGAISTNTITLAAIGSVAVGQIVTGTGIPGLAIGQGPVTVTAISGAQITLSANLTAQAAGTYSFYVAGIMVGWGVNTTYGNLGDGTFATQTTPVQIFASGIAEVFNGNNDYPVACVRKTDNTWWVAGAGAYSANLDSGAANRSSWVQITYTTITSTNYITKVIKSGTGSYNWMAALLVDGTIVAWGYNGYGVLGVGDITNRIAPTQVLLNNASRKPVDIAGYCSSNEQTMLIQMDDGSLMATGFGGSYCNTDDRAQSSSVPFPVIM